MKVFLADNPIDTDPRKLYVTSNLPRPLHEIPQEADTRICNFFREINGMFKRKSAIPNLLPSQKNLLLWLKNHETWLVSNTDKNLGPCVIEISTYIRDAVIHLQDTSTYATINKDEAAEMCDDLYKQIFAWTAKGRKNKTISDDESKYTRKHSEHNCKDPYGYFYLLYKVHKTRKLGAPVPTYQTCKYVLTVAAPLTSLASG